MLLLSLLLGCSLGLPDNQERPPAHDPATRGDPPGDDNATTDAEDEVAVEGESRAQAAAAHLIGQPGPTQVIRTLSHGDVDLGDLRGKKPVYLKFWATWCAPCRVQTPGLEAIYQAQGDTIQVVAVNTGYADSVGAVRAFAKRMSLTAPISIDDGTLADQLGLTVTPQHIVIGRDGLISWVGHRDGPALERALNAALAAPDTEPTAAEAAPARPVLLTGHPVGDLSATTTSGTTWALGGPGARRAVMFFSPWCESYLADTRPEVAAACKNAREGLESIHGIERLAVSDRLWATESDLRDHAATTGTSVPLALDQDGLLFRSFGVRDIPSVALIRADGTLERVVGPKDGLVSAVRAFANDRTERDQARHLH